MSKIFITPSDEMYAVFTCATKKNREVNTDSVFFRVMKLKDKEWVQVGKDLHIESKTSLVSGFAVFNDDTVILSLKDNFKHIKPQHAVLFTMSNGSWKSHDLHQFNIYSIQYGSFSQKGGFCFFATTNKYGQGYFFKFFNNTIEQLGEIVDASEDGVLAASSDGDLYIFGIVNGPPGKLGTVARWDGAKWVSLGAGLDAEANIPQYVLFFNSISVASNGTVYVAGRFNKSGKKTIRAFARYEGNKWNGFNFARKSNISDLDTGTCIAAATDNSAYALFNDSLYHCIKGNCSLVVADKEHSPKDITIAPDNSIYSIFSHLTPQSGGGMVTNLAKIVNNKWVVVGDEFIY